jgi:hypothetical protein
MATMTISTAFTADIVDSLTYRNAADSAYEYPTWQFFNSGDSSHISRGAEANSTSTPEKGSLFAGYSVVNNGGSGGTMTLATSLTTFAFCNASGTTLTSWTAHEIESRTIDANGYCVLTNFPQKTPAVAGTIEQLVITNGVKVITFVVGDEGSSSDVEFNDRTLITTQPWRLDTSIKFRIPMAWNWST